MNFRHKHRRLTAVLLLSLVFVLAFGCISVEAAPKWELYDYRTIRDGNTMYYVKDNALYKRVNGKDTLLTKWNLTGDSSLSIVDGYKNNINICVTRDLGGPITQDLYTVNYKTGKKVKAITSFLQEKAFGPYIYGQLGDSYEKFIQNPIYIWKASGNKMKKIGKLIDFPSNVPVILNNKVYFGTNTGGDTSILEVYKSNPNGKGRKKLFTLKSETGTMSLLYVMKDKIAVIERVDGGDMYGETAFYAYDMKTGKISKVAMEDI